MSRPSLFFVLDELRRKLDENAIGVMLGLGPGITLESMLLRAVGSHK
ncbi:hypothetical protein ACP70R_033923 [Stipagrostis hirtigluma subsp. patula]